MDYTTDNCWFCGALHKIEHIYTANGLTYRSVCNKCDRLVEQGELDPYA